MAIETMEGLVQALPEAERESAQAFLAAHVAAQVEPFKSKHDAAFSELRKAKSAVGDWERKAAAWEADLANLRDLAGKAGEHEQRATVAETALAALKAEHERAQARAKLWERERFEKHVAEAGELDRDRPQDAHYLVDHLGLTPAFDDAGQPVLDEAASKRLKDFLAKPENRAAYVKGGRRFYQEPGPADPNRPQPPKLPDHLKNLDPHTRQLILGHTGLSLP